LDRKKLDRSTNEIQSLRNALEALRMDNENIKIQLQRPTPMVDNSQTAKKLQQQLQICQKDNDSLKR
jgi:regulator of replication initiation timing